MYKKTLVFIFCVVLVSKTLKSQVVSVEGVWHAETVQYAASFSLGFWFVNTRNTPIIDSDSEDIDIISYNIWIKENIK
tara:strand:+ start:417 stop:650 length:234 start_codon:yes stop_codon:yes gene_type:complete